MKAIINLIISLVAFFVAVFIAGSTNIDLVLRVVGDRPARFKL